MTIHILITQEEKIDRIASIFERHNLKIIPHPVLESKREYAFYDLLSKVKELYSLDHQKILVLQSPKGHYTKLGIYLPERNNFKWLESSGTRSTEKVCSEYVLRFHSSPVQEMSCREDISILKSFVTKTGAVAFGTDPKIWIASNSFFQKLNRPMYSRLLNFVLNERGMFPKVWQLEAQKNYWNSTYNGGLPIIRKRDPIHEGAFMLHDTWHFVFIDPIITGKENDLEIMAYIANRLMSEAFTLVLTDMIAINHSNIDQDGYDVARRKIYPVFSSTNSDSHNLEVVRRFLYTNSAFALFGDTSEYEKLGVDSEVFADFATKYSVFFSVDLQWNLKNAHNQIKRFSTYKNLARYIEELPLEIKNQSSSSLYQRIRQEDGLLSFDRLFDIFWDQFLAVVLYDKPFDHLECARQGIQKYISGQVYAAFMYGDICESDELIHLYKKSVSEVQLANKLEELLQIYRNFQTAFEKYLACLEKKEIILPDERVICTLHVPHFPPIYSGYDNPKDSYESLPDVSRRIFRDKLSRRVEFNQPEDHRIDATTRHIFRSITKE